MLYTLITLIVCMFWASSSEYYLREIVTVCFPPKHYLLSENSLCNSKCFSCTLKFVNIYLKHIYLKISCLNLDGHLNGEFGWNLVFVSLKWQIKLFHRRRGSNICCCLHFSSVIKVLWRVKKGNVFFLF